MDQNLEKKYRHLQSILQEAGRVAVAYSSGVDSTFLLQTAVDVLGKDAVIAVTVKSCSFPKRELEESVSWCREQEIRHFIVESEELEIEGFRQNPPDRCYLCKKEIFGKIISLAEKEGITYVAEGSNMDDTGDFRPGLRAIAQLKVKSPLREAGLYKEEIRDLSRMLGLPTAGKPSFACLASRFPYGEEITREKLKMVDQAEQLLMNLGFTQFRVRIHGKLARIEVLPEALDTLFQEDLRQMVTERLQSFGFTWVTVDLKGYRTGSMNESLSAKEKERALRG